MRHDAADEDGDSSSSFLAGRRGAVALALADHGVDAGLGDGKEPVNCYLSVRKWSCKRVGETKGWFSDGEKTYIYAESLLGVLV